ncbi:hypothetical protein IHE33_05000 [Mycetohabitans endofungorum]|uniref:hypothetical protein n=1 Tax=Mycetohabitans endofungorum TaxID=417203 RepID=UPI0030D4702E
MHNYFSRIYLHSVRCALVTSFCCQAFQSAFSAIALISDSEKVRNDPIAQKASILSIYDNNFVFYFLTVGNSYYQP